MCFSTSSTHLFVLYCIQVFSKVKNVPSIQLLCVNEYNKSQELLSNFFPQSHHPKCPNKVQNKFLAIKSTHRAENGNLSSAAFHANESVIQNELIDHTSILCNQTLAQLLNMICLISPRCWKTPRQFVTQHQRLTRTSPPSSNTPANMHLLTPLNVVTFCD